jgi:Cache domain.
VAFPKAQKDLEEALIRNLEGVKQKQVEIVKMWFDEKKRDAKVISRNVSSVMERNADDKSRGFPKLNEHLEMVKSEYGYKAVRITSRDGTVLVATERGCVGSNVMNDDYCREALNGNVFLSKIQYLVSGERKNKQSDGNVPVMFLSAPLLDSSNRITGAAVFTVDTLPLTEIMKSAKLGKTGETFLINREGCMLTESPFAGEIRKAGLVQQGTALALRVINPYTGKLTEGVQRCLSGNDGYDADGYKNYDGRKVLGAWRWIPEYDCGLLAQIDIREGYGAARSLKMFAFRCYWYWLFP